MLLFPRYWLLNAVPHICTHAALKFLIEKLLASELSETEAAMALLECLQSVTADQKTIELVRVSLFLSFPIY